MLDRVQWRRGRRRKVQPWRGDSGISQARRGVVASRWSACTTSWWGRCGAGPAGGVVPQWRLASSTLHELEVDGAQRAGVREGGQYPGEPGASAFPQVRLDCRCWKAARTPLFGRCMGPLRDERVGAGRSRCGGSEAGMLVGGPPLLRVRVVAPGAATGADLLWRPVKKAGPPCEQRLRDGSYLSTVYAAAPAQRGRAGAGGGVPPGGQSTIRAAVPPGERDPERLPARAGRHLPRAPSIETAFDKTHLRGARMVLRSKTPELQAGVLQRLAAPCAS